MLILIVFFSGTLLQSSVSYTGVFHLVPVVFVAVVVVWFVVWFVSSRGLDDGLGRVCRFAVPLLFVLLIFIVVFSLTLPGAGIGLRELFSPDWSLLAHFDIWLAAFGQILFSLSLGFSIAFTYAAYAQDGSDLVSNTFIIVFANALFENIAAVGVFSVLGYMSFYTATPFAEVVSDGVGLVFVAYPMVFNVLGDWGYVLGPLFFLVVYLAGLTSILASMEPILFPLQDKFNVSRKRVVSLICFMCAVGCVFYSTSFGSALIGYVDMFINQILVLFVVIIECVLFAWVFDADSLVGVLNRNSRFVSLGGFWSIIVKYILPILVAVIWIGGISDIQDNLNTTQIIFFIIQTLIFLITIILFTRLSPKNPEWDKINRR